MSPKKFLQGKKREAFDAKKEDVIKADIRVISGCEDAQTSSDIRNVKSFHIPDPAGRAAGALTSSLLSVLYKDEKKTTEDLSFTQVLQEVRKDLRAKGLEQIPQLTASHAIDVNIPFDLDPPSSTGTRRAVMIGINYVGQEYTLRGCQNDVKNMMNYIKKAHGFEDKNITLLMDDGQHEMPTRVNILNAFKKAVEQSQPGDILFCHYSGHGAKLKDDEQGEEADGFDETIVPVDTAKAEDLIRDDDLFDVIVKPMKEKVYCVIVMDCCHSGTVLDLPYVFKADGEHDGMEIDEDFNFKRFLGKVGFTLEQIFGY